MKKPGIRLIKSLFAMALLTLMTVSCQKHYSVSDLLGTWSYDEDPEYSITFRKTGLRIYYSPYRCLPLLILPLIHWTASIYTSG